MRLKRRVAYLGLSALALLSSPSAPRRAGTPPSVRASVDARVGAKAEEPPAGLSREDWGQVRNSIEASSYHAARVGRPGKASALVASNRSQGYGTTFRPAGIEIARQARPDSWHMSLAMTGYGYASELHPLEPAEPVTRKDRVEYRRGSVTEWYVNRPQGLEQGFELREPPGTRSGEPLVVEMTVGGDLQVAADGDGAAFADHSGATQLRYVGLTAWDADARPVTSRMEAADGRLRLVLEASEARFPVTVDPTFIQETRLLGHSDPVSQPEVLFGSTVSVSGDTLVVGAAGEDSPGRIDAGAAYVFVRSDTTWIQQARLAASDGGGSFGAGVSVSGDVAVIGAPSGGDLTTPGYEGAAYVFVRSGTTWTEQAKLTALDGQFGDNFGSSVSLSGDTVVVGAPGAHSADTAYQGAAYVLVRSGTTWAEQAKLTASDGASSSYFGRSVSVSGDTVAIAVPQAQQRPGEAYVFVRSGATWTEQAKLTATDGVTGDGFAHSLSLSGDTVVIGAPWHTSGGPAGAGAAYVFVRSGATWTEQAMLIASDRAEHDLLGYSVSLFGDTAVAGALLIFVGDAVVEEGAAYVFERSGTTWTERQKLVASDAVPHQQLGYSVSVSGETLALGAPGAPGPGSPHAGAAYAFVRPALDWTEQAKMTAPAPSLDDGAWDQFGASVSVAGETVVVGAPDDRTAGGARAGSAYVFTRSGAAWSEQKLTASDATDHDHFGASVSVSGDTLVVGAPDEYFYGAGGAYVFVGSGTSWYERQKLVPSSGGGEWMALYGRSVSVSGDTAVVGSFAQSPSFAGAVHVFVRSGTAWSEQQRLVLPGGAASDLFGSAVSVSGDTLVVANGWGPGVHVFVRSATTWTEQAVLLPSSGSGDEYFGQSVSLSGDTLVVGASLADTAACQRCGAAYVFARSGTTWTEQQKLGAADGAHRGGDGFGSSVFVSGNTLVVGAPGDDIKGAAYLFARSGTTWTQRQKLSAADGTYHDNLGASVAFSPNTVVAGAPNRATADGLFAGAAYVFREGPPADLRIALSNGHTVSAPGESVTYTVSVANAGPSPAAGAVVTDVFPDALTCSTTCSATGGAACTPGPFAGNINDTVNIAPGQSIIYTSACTISLGATGTLSNTAVVTPPPSLVDPRLDNNTSTDTDTLTASADLAVVVTHAPDPVAPGEALAYQIQVTNLGPSTSTGMQVTDTLPAGVTYVSSTPRANFCAFGEGALVCRLGPLSPGGTHTMSIEATVEAGTRGVLGNTGSVVGYEPDPVGVNNSDTNAVLVSTNTQFFTVVPCRVVDTRSGSGAPVGGPALAARSTRVFTLAGHCGIPSAAQAVALNITVIHAGADGNLRVFPAGLTLPLVSTVNYRAGQTRGTNAVIALDADGEIAVYADQVPGTTVNVIIDVSGYFE